MILLEFWGIFFLNLSKFGDLSASSSNKNRELCGASKNTM